MKAEKERGEKYPNRYKFVTGSNAEKSVGIANSTSNGEFVINGSSTVNGKKVYANIPVSYYDILDIVIAYDRLYQKRRDELHNILIIWSD